MYIPEVLFLVLVAESFEQRVHYERCNLEKYDVEKYVPNLFLPLF